MRCMTNGGGRWDDIIPADPWFIDRQIDAQASDGVGEWAARRFVLAMQNGGLTDAEAWSVMRDRFCAHLGTGCELWDVDDVPIDRWFRNAWRRSHNGGPIGIALPIARKIQLARLRSVAKRRGLDLRWDRWRQRIRAAETPEQLKHVWPQV